MEPKQNTAFLPYLDDRQLMSLFVATTTGSLSQRAKAILAELLERGYFFDVSRREFLTENQWKLLYRETPPADYFAYWQAAHHEPPSRRRRVGP